jgi:hypothetical protein
MALDSATEAYLRDYINDLSAIPPDWNAGPSGGIMLSQSVDVFAIASVLNHVTLSNTPNSSYNPQIYLNGILQRDTTDYSIAGTTVIFTFNLSIGDTVQAIYWI